MKNLAENLEIKSYQPSYATDLINLWKECNMVAPNSNPQRDIYTKLSFQPNMLYVGLIDGKLVASVMIGYEGHRGWINFLVVKPEFQRKGIGRRMMGFAEEVLVQLGCPKIKLQVITSNKSAIAFYDIIGFEVDDVISLGKRLK